MPTNHSIIPLILCGGSGSRLWPLSRKNFPKQFLDLYQEKSLFLSALERALIIAKDSPIFISVSKELEYQSIEAVSNFKNIKILVEPENKGTGPAICLSALIAESIEADAYILAMPADLFIQENQALYNAVNESMEYASTSWVTFGIKPTFPSTDLGYIESINSDANVMGVEKFIEKPNKIIAEELLTKKNIFWNSGIFFSKARNIIDSFKLNSNDTYINSMKILSGLDSNNREIYFDNDLFKNFINNSIDYEILEKNKSIKCINLKTEWKDLGTWQSVAETFSKDSNGNSSNSKLLALNAENNFIFSEKQLAVMSNVRDILVVESGDSILVAKKSDPSILRNVYKHLEDNSYEEISNSQISYRPWGKFKSLYKKDTMQIKILTLNPGESISLQTHNHRSENWLVLEGKATVTLGKKEFTLLENETVFIEQNMLHRLANKTKKILKILECQRGNYLGEDDIKRYEDVYNRD